MRELPLVELKEIVKPRREKVLPNSVPDLKFIGLEHIESNTTKIIGSASAASMKSAANKFSTGDVLYSRLRPYLNKVTRVDFDGLCSSEFIVIPESEYLSSQLLTYRLNSSDFVRFASRLNTGDRPRVDFDQISEFKVPLFSVPEQRRIVAKLEELFSDLDAATAALERVQANLKRYRASVLKSAVEGKLTAEWRAKNPPKETGAQLLVRILKERRAKWEENQLAKYKVQRKEPPKDWQKKYVEPVKPDTTDLLELPEGWVWATVDMLAVGVKNGIAEKPSQVSQGTPILRISAVRPMKVDIHEVRYIHDAADYSSEDYVQNGDVLFTRYNGSMEFLGVCGIVRNLIGPCLYPDKLIKVNLIKQDYAAFIEMAANVGISRRHIVSKARTTAGQTGISGMDIKSMPIPLCSNEEIQLIVQSVSSIQPSFEVNSNALEQKLQQVKSLRQAILKQAFEGKLVPQDPNDEPASELLKRIRKERISEAANKTIRPELKEQKPKTKHARSVEKTKSITNRKRA